MVEEVSDIHSQHWSKERLHADATRAVGGIANLVREAARICQQLSPETPREWICKRIQFLAYELQSLTRDAMDESEKLRLLNEFLFVKKAFRCVIPVPGDVDQIETLRLDRVLSERAAQPLILELLYAHLAEQIGVSLEFVDLKPTFFLKWRDKDRSRYIDVMRAGAILSSDELIEVLHTRFQLTSFNVSTAFEACTFETFITDFVSMLRRAIASTGELEKLLFLQDTLIAYQPSNILLTGERALLHRRLGNFKGALADLKRYFAFQDRERAPIELVRLHEELLQLLRLERSKTNIEIID